MIPQGTALRLLEADVSRDNGGPALATLAALGMGAAVAEWMAAPLRPTRRSGGGVVRKAA